MFLSEDHDDVIVDPRQRFGIDFPSLSCLHAQTSTFGKRDNVYATTNSGWTSKTFIELSFG